MTAFLPSGVSDVKIVSYGEATCDNGTADATINFPNDVLTLTPSQQVINASIAQWAGNGKLAGVKKDASGNPVLFLADGAQIVDLVIESGQLKAKWDNGTETVLSNR